MKRIFAAALTLLLVGSFLACTPSVKKEDAASSGMAEPQPAATEEPGGEAVAESDAPAQPDQSTPPADTAGSALTFSLTTLQGDPIDESYLASHKVTMVNFWATWCGYCVQEMPDLAAISGEYDSADFGLLGVLTWDDDVDGATAFLSNNGITYPVINAEGVFADMSDTFTGLPTTLFLDAEGNVLVRVVGARSGDDWRTIIDTLLEQQG